jgi:DNA-binding PadR family transcriptional regulator
MLSSLPPITHMQFLVLEALAEGERHGRDLRARLAAYRVRSSGPAFYQMMARLEQSGLVEGWYEQALVHGQHVKERRYRLARPGRRALDETRRFYLARLAPAVRKRPSNA